MQRNAYTGTFQFAAPQTRQNEHHTWRKPRHLEQIEICYFMI